MGGRHNSKNFPIARKNGAKDKELITSQLFLWSLMTNELTSGQSRKSMHYLSPQHLLRFLEMNITSLLWRNLQICIAANTVLSRFFSCLKINACSFAFSIILIKLSTESTQHRSDWYFFLSLFLSAKQVLQYQMF